MYIHGHVFTINDLVIKVVVLIPTLFDVSSWKHSAGWYMEVFLRLTSKYYMNTIEELGVTILTLYT